MIGNARTRGRPWLCSFFKGAVWKAAFCLTALSLGCATDDGNPPNIILILTDDQGWTSVSYRSDPAVPDSKSDYIETPQLERAARQGMRFTDAYAAGAICSPSRHAVLFGQNVARHEYAKSLDWLEEARGWLTIPKVLKEANPGYRTAHFGKWHVAVTPEDAGFDFTDGLTASAAGNMQNGRRKDTRDIAAKLRRYNVQHRIEPPRLNNRYSSLPVSWNDEDPKGAVSMTRRAEAFMRESVAAGKPFFAYIAHFAPHLDLVSSEETYQYFKDKKPGKLHDKPGYAAMTKDLDASIGRVLDLVKELGIDDNTYIFITSDNGGAPHFGQSALLNESGEIVETHQTSIVWRNLPLRHGKHELYEGGIRVPFLVVAPGVEPNSVSRAGVTGTDFLPTFAELAGHSRAFPDHVDGDSIVSVLHSGGKGTVRRRREALIFHQAANRIPISALRKGKYKLVKHWMAGENCLPELSKSFPEGFPRPGWSREFCGENLLELYDLSSDLGESKDLSGEMPELTDALHKELLAFLEQANAETKFTGRGLTGESAGAIAYNTFLEKRGLGSKYRIMVKPEYKSPFKQSSFTY